MIYERKQKVKKNPWKKQIEGTSEVSLLPSEANEQDKK